ncbi:MAG: hypothetical protein ABW049_00645 [Spongiibacteraceae bacterium]
MEAQVRAPARARFAIDRNQVIGAKTEGRQQGIVDCGDDEFADLAIGYRRIPIRIETFDEGRIFIGVKTVVGFTRRRRGDVAERGRVQGVNAPGLDQRFEARTQGLAPQKCGVQPRK